MPDPVCLGIDTSCYTTSVACANEKSIVFFRGTMLSVPLGGRGLRQSDGLFQHVKQLPGLLSELFSGIDRSAIRAIAVSAAPTSRPDSYMPVFLAGLSQAESLASALSVPLIRVDHQSGHIRAALYGNETLLEKERFLAAHVSGGTTDLLLVEPHRDAPYRIEPVGTSTDLHAGQFVDRVGVALRLPFPAGRHLETLAVNAAEKNVKLPSAVDGTNCSLSGAESAAQRLIGAVPDEELAFGVYDCLARTLSKMFASACEQFGDLPVLVCGGVASSRLLRTLLKKRFRGRLYFGRPEFSSDNAVGVALLGADRSAAWKN
ncbi:MAG: O-sialoglycoprotein endopeptidase [Clostridia bacterium]|nr:O-sialoglycoprotein endopeptidase [Clostridia bacterium]